MTYDWYKLFNKVQFEADEVPSRTLTLPLEGRGNVTFEIFKGNYLSILYDGMFLPVQFQGQNPYPLGSYAVYKDGNDDIWFGFEVAE